MLVTLLCLVGMALWSQQIFATAFAHLSLRDVIVVVIAINVDISLMSLITFLAFPLLGCIIPLELLRPLRLLMNALFLFIGLHFLYFLLDLPALQKLICDEIPSDYTLFTKTDNILLKNIILLKWRILFE